METAYSPVGDIFECAVPEQRYNSNYISCDRKHLLQTPPVPLFDSRTVGSTWRFYDVPFLYVDLLLNSPFFDGFDSRLQFFFWV